MPNLGRLDGDPCLGAEKYSSEATLADLPGLIEGAHLGKVKWVLHFGESIQQYNVVLLGNRDYDCSCYMFHTTI